MSILPTLGPAPDRKVRYAVGDLDDTVAVTLRFAQGRAAQFVLSHRANAIDTCVVGTKGGGQMITMGESRTARASATPALSAAR